MKKKNVRCDTTKPEKEKKRKENEFEVLCVTFTSNNNNNNNTHTVWQQGKMWQQRRTENNYCNVQVMQNTKE